MESGCNSSNELENNASPPPRPVHIIDSTLREGNQAPSVTFSPEQASIIARLLEFAGVDMIAVSYTHLTLPTIYSV